MRKLKKLRQTKIFIDCIRTQERFVGPQKSGQVRLSWVKSYLGRVTEWNAEIEMKRREMFQAKKIYRQSDEDISLKQRKYIWRKKDILKQRGLCIFNLKNQFVAQTLFVTFDTGIVTGIFGSNFNCFGVLQLGLGGTLVVDSARVYIMGVEL